MVIFLPGFGFIWYTTSGILPGARLRPCQRAGAFVCSVLRAGDESNVRCQYRISTQHTTNGGVLFSLTFPLRRLPYSVILFCSVAIHLAGSAGLAPAVFYFYTHYIQRWVFVKGFWEIHTMIQSEHAFYTIRKQYRTRVIIYDMGKKINVPIPIPIETDDKPRTKVLENGAVYDLDKKKITGGAVLSSDRARDMVRARVEKKRAVIAQAAQAAVQNGALVGRYGDAAWLAEVAQAQYTLATTPDAGKSSVMAASWLVENSGMGEPKGKDTDDDGGVTAAADLVRALADFAAAIPRQIHATIDGDLVE